MAAKTKKAKPAAPPKKEKPDPKVRRIPINAIQARGLTALNSQSLAAQKADEGAIRAQAVLNAYFSATLHAAGEAKEAALLGVDRGIGKRYILSYRVA